MSQSKPPFNMVVSYFVRAETTGLAVAGSDRAKLEGPCTLCPPLPEAAITPDGGSL